MKKKGQMNIPKTYWLRAVCLACTAGIAYYYYFSEALIAAVLLLGLIVIVTVVWREKQMILLSVLVSLALLLGIWRMQASLHQVHSGTLDFYNGREAQVTGVIEQPPDSRPDRTYLSVQVREMKLESESRPVTGKLLVTIPSLPAYQYGDEVEIEGELLTPDNTGTFNYAQYLSKDDIFSVMQDARVTVLQTGRGNPVLAFLFAMRQKMEAQINLLFPEPSSSLFAGLLLGIRKNIPADLSDNLQKTGLTHIIAISGFNITIIISFLAGFLLRGLRRSIRFTAATVAVVLFTLLVGASASVVRAAIMGIAGLLALSLGRKSEALTILLVALALMTLLHPLSLLLDIGFQLSFLATLGLILLSPPLEKIFRKAPSFFFIKETLITTLSAQILVLPVLLLQFQQVSLIAPVTNILVLPVISLVMLLGFAALVVSFVPFFFLLAKIIGFVAWLLISYIILIVQLFSALPFASLEVTWWSSGLSLLFYLLLAGLLVSWHLRAKNKTQPKSLHPAKN